jgi:hypothetical protein
VIHIEYINGMLRGNCVYMAMRYAEPVVKRGYARIIP